MNEAKTEDQGGSRYTNREDEDDLGLERDIESLHEKICEFEIYLMQMDAAVGGLQKERDKMDQENIELQSENERFLQEIKFEKIHNADLKNELKKARRNKLKTTGEEEKQPLDSGFLGTAHPLFIIKSAVHRILLFTWWSAFWFYEGLSIFGWENKWAKMEKKKRRLEEENEEIEGEVARLKKYIAEQQKDLVSEKHTNIELLNQLTECVDVNNRKIMVLEEIWKKVEAYTNILEDHFDELKKQEGQKLTGFEGGVGQHHARLRRDTRLYHARLPEDSGLYQEGSSRDTNGDDTTPASDRVEHEDGDGTLGDLLGYLIERLTGSTLETSTNDSSMVFLVISGSFMALFTAVAMYVIGMLW